jgi:transcription factor SPN1
MASPSISPVLTPISGMADEDDVQDNLPEHGAEAPAAATETTAALDIDAFSDDDSALSEVDEAQFEDFDPANIAIEERPAIAVDEETVKLLARHKRKRDGEVDGEGAKKKRKEGRREKKPRKKRDEDDNFSGGEELEGKRPRKKKLFAEGGERREKARPRAATPENEEGLSPEESECQPCSMGSRHGLLTGEDHRTKKGS